MPAVKIRCSYLRGAAFAFLLLPVLLFLCGFVKTVIAIPVSLLLLVCYGLALQERRRDTAYLQIPLLRLLAFGGIFLVWCWLGGQGNLFYQPSDWNERNAIFRDLICRSWPVYYPETNTALVYYIGHWLPAASLGKLLFAVSGDLELAFAVGNILLALWSFLGIMLTLLLMLTVVKPKAGWGQWLVPAVFLGFSGLDILGTVIMKWPLDRFLSELHLEWWANRYQFSSTTTCLFWVFNQAVPAWVVTLCFAGEKSPRNYAFLVGCALPCAPFPCVGLGILMVGKVLYEAVQRSREKRLGSYLKDIFSFSNTVTAVCWVPIICSYLLSNVSIQQSMGSAAGSVPAQISKTMMLFSFVIVAAAVLAAAVAFVLSRAFKKNTPFFFTCAALLFVSAALLYLFPQTGFSYFVFLALECGLYWLLVAPDHHRDPMLYLIGLAFLLVPCIRMGFSADFCMRASIPALTVLLMMCAGKLCRWLDAPKACKKWQKVTCALLVVLLVIGLATPAMEVFRGIYKTVQAGTVLLPADNIYTLNKYAAEDILYRNFVAADYPASLFFRYFARLLQ